MFVFPFLGILGVAWAVVSGLKRWERRAVAVTLLVVSGVMATGIAPAYACTKIGILLLPLARARATQAAHREAESYKAEKKAHYEALSQRFQTPQRVVEVRPPFVLLEDQLVVKLLGIDGSGGGAERFRAWAPDNLLGHEVMVVLPNREIFESQYVPGVYSGFFGPHPKDARTGTPYGDVPAFVLLEGELVNKRFSRYPDLLERDFRKHAASVR